MLVIFSLVVGYRRRIESRIATATALLMPWRHASRNLVAADGGVVGSEELLERAWDENADPFTSAVRITVSALRKRLGEPWITATVPGVGYRIDTGSAHEHG